MKSRNRWRLRRRPGVLWTVLLVIALVGTGAGIGITQAVGGDEPREKTTETLIPIGENGQPLTPRDQLELIGKANPGFGGYVIDQDDRSIVTVLMTDIKDMQAAERAAAAALGSQQPISEVRVAQADFLYTDLAEWFRQVNQHVIPEIMDVLTGYSIMEDKNRIEIGVVDITAKGKIVQLLQELGIPVRAVEIHEEGRFEPLSHDLTDTR